MGQLILGKTSVVEGQRFNELKVQTSKEGVPRPIIFGTVRPIVGNVIAAAEPRIVEVRERSGGKGGGGIETRSDEVYRTYAIRICEGPVTGVTRIWRNNDLVYSRDSEDAAQIENNNAFLEIVEFFLGGFDQQPSAVLQGAFGVDEVPPYRGTCYMVVDDENLTSNNGAIPQYRFEVERCVGTFLTSKPYPVYLQNASETTNVTLDRFNLFKYIKDTNLKPEGAELTAVTLDNFGILPLIQEYTVGTEGAELTAVTLDNFDIVEYVITTEILTEGAELTAVTLDNFDITPI